MKTRAMTPSMVAALVQLEGLKGVMCASCDGLGHTQVGCPTTAKLAKAARCFTYGPSFIARVKRATTIVQRRSTVKKWKTYVKGPPKKKRSSV